MKKFHTAAAIALLVQGLVAQTQAQNSLNQMNYQGQLVDSSGTSLPNGNYSLTFGIWSAATGPSLLWGPVTNASVPLIGGRFNVMLGPNDSQGRFLSATLATNATAFLQISVGNNTAISPRQQILSAPYAMRSESLSGFGWDQVFTDTLRPDTGHIPGSKIVNGSITSNQLATATVGMLQIANGAVSTPQIANFAVSTPQIANFAVGTLQLGIGAVGTAQIAGGAVGSAQIAPGSISSTHLAPPISLSSFVDDANGRSSISAVLYITNSGRTIITANAFPAWGLVVGGVNAIKTQSGYSEFNGDVQVNGNLAVSGAKNFKIDHPTDPANKYLYHACVESSEMKNIYDGVVVLDDRGEALAQLPSWFEALNKDFRYQLTAIGAPGPNLYIAEEVSSNHFKIAGGAAGMKVSWQVTGVRHDAYANAHPTQVEVEKPKEVQGYFLHPEEHGQSRSKSIATAKRTISSAQN